MPYKSVWVNPEVFMTYKGVKVYHTYKDDDFNDGPSDCWYTLDKAHSDGNDDNEFDVTSLSTWLDSKSEKDAIRRAIDSGELKAPEEE